MGVCVITYTSGKPKGCEGSDNKNINYIMENSQKPALNVINN